MKPSGASLVSLPCSVTPPSRSRTPRRTSPRRLASISSRRAWKARTGRSRFMAEQHFEKFRGWRCTDDSCAVLHRKQHAAGDHLDRPHLFRARGHLISPCQTERHVVLAEALVTSPAASLCEDRKAGNAPQVKAISIWQPWASLWCSPRKGARDPHWPTRRTAAGCSCTPPSVSRSRRRPSCGRSQSRVRRVLVFRPATGALIGAVKLIRCEGTDGIVITDEDHHCGDFSSDASPCGATSTAARGADSPMSGAKAS